MSARRRPLQLLLTIAVLPVLVLVPLAFAAAPGATFEGRYVLRHSDDFAGGRAVFEPALASNLTWMIQGLVVLLVSTDVLVVYLMRLRRRRKVAVAA